MKKRCAAVFLICWTVSFAGRAAESDSVVATNVLAGHSMHGEVFNEGPRQGAYLMPGMPKIDFPISSKAPQAQAYFNQGIGQLHGFWYFEAERTFRQIAALDPQCPMAFWGMAMANINNSKRAKEFIQKAAALKEHADDREKLWIEALEAYHKDGDSKKRRRDYVRALENIVQQYPNDVEAKAFLVFQIWDNSSRDLPISSHQAVDALLDQILQASPMHPAHHYRIHLWDSEKPVRALGSAALCGQSSPGIAHMWHMSGHTFSKLHRYADAAWQQEASARVDHAHMMRDRVLPDQIHNFAHNNSWLVDDLLHIGRVHDAVDLARNMIELPRHPKYNTLEKSNSSSLGRGRLFDALVKYELWDRLIELSETIYLEPTELRAEQARRARLLGLAWFSKGELKKGRKEIDALEKLLKDQKRERQDDADKAEAKAKADKKSDSETSKAMADALQSHAEKIKSIERAIKELKAYEALAEKKMEEARKQFEELKDLPKERLARIYWEIGDKEKAEELAREAVQGATNQVHVLAHYVDILNGCEKKKEAGEQFERLRSLCAQADLDMPVFKRLQPLAAELQLPSDWRPKYEPPSDAGQRPQLDSLGPFRWEPSLAPEWALPDAEGKTIALRDYRGRPVIVIFYLGYGCPHCIEQLNAFAPLKKDFSEAGISLVAVSTDSVSGLKKSLEKSKEEEGFPFPLVSNESLDIFKAYRAFDDFEQKPLHGTFLVNGQGKVCWQDISFEPFTNTKFLLSEAKRLLGQVDLKLARGSGRDALTAMRRKAARKGAERLQSLEVR
jgi:peroxiredoxin/tetratricopeptide (TPR) repeat protein